MFQVTQEIEFCYGHRLLNYAGKCRHLYGHNGRILITLESTELDTPPPSRGWFPRFCTTFGRKSGMQ